MKCDNHAFMSQAFRNRIQRMGFPAIAQPARISVLPLPPTLTAELSGTVSSVCDSVSPAVKEVLKFWVTH